MKRLDVFVLRLTHRISDATYRKFGIDNYAIGVTFFVLALVASLGIYFSAMEMAKHDIDPKVADMRIRSSLFALFFFGVLSVVAIFARKKLRHFLQVAYDTESVTNIQPVVARLLRWMFVFMYVINLVPAFFGASIWWGNVDALLIGLGLMFLSTEPPSMEERMRRAF